MTMRVGLRLDGDHSGAKQSLRETDADLKQLTTSAQAAGAAGAGMGRNMAAGANMPVPAMRLNQQQLANMQFQLNDMAVGLASGQSPFTVMMQQGMQVGQMFGPGSTVMGALRATGAGFVSFLTNPINLFVAATAVAAGAVPMIFEAFTGPEAKSAEDVLEDIDDQLKGLEDRFDNAGEAARNMIAEASAAGSLETLSGLNSSANEAKRLLGDAQEEALGLFRQLASATSEGTTDPLLEDLEEIARKLGIGQLEASKAREEVAAIGMDPSASSEAQDFADDLLTVAKNAATAAANVAGIDSAMARVRGDVPFNSIGFNEAMAYRAAAGGRSDPASEREAALEAMGKAAERAAREAEREARRSARQAQRMAEQRAANADLIGDLEAEVAALGLVGNARDEALAQLKEEQQIRQAIDNLGEAGTAAEVARIRTLIPLRNEMLENSKRQADQLRDEEQAARGTASGIASLTRQLASGADAGELFSGMLLNMGSRLLESGLLSLMGIGASPLQGSGPLGLLSLLFNAKGNAFDNGQVMAFANGAAFTNSIVTKPTLFPFANGTGLMGEAGPEAIMPLRRGADGRLGVSAAGGGASAIQIMLGEGLVASILSQAEDQSVSIVDKAAPSIAGAGASQGRDLAKSDFARKRWTRV